jgi:hypothetical protein
MEHSTSGPKSCKLRNRWDIVSKWIERVNPDELSTKPMKDERGRDGWCEQAIWHNFRIRSEIEVGDKQQAIVAAQRAIGLFPQQAKFFKRLEALETSASVNSLKPSYFTANFLVAENQIGGY